MDRAVTQRPRAAPADQAQQGTAMAAREPIATAAPKHPALRPPEAIERVSTAEAEQVVAEVVAEPEAATTDASPAPPAPLASPLVTAHLQKPQPNLNAQHPPPDFASRLEIPRELPGAEAPPIVLPPVDLDVPGVRSEAIDALFPLLPQMGGDPHLHTSTESGKLSLTDLQEMAISNNPVIVQAAADVEVAMGQVISAGAYPNPTFGYEADTVGSGGTRNYQGLFFTQTIKTAGKLELARASANVDLMNTQLALRNERIDLISRVRTQYFAALIARQAVASSSALVRFTNEVYRVQVEQLKGGQAAAYEPMQLRVLAVQARAALVQARNRYASAWKQLAATVGVPDLPLAELEGRSDMRVPAVDYNAALSWVLANHTDILTARNGEHQARIDLRLQEVTPVPDVELYSAIQKDFTTPPVKRTTYNLQVGIPVPIFNRNKGGILSAQGKLVRASEEVARVRNQLITRLADAFERYESNRIQADYYRTQVLPDLSRVYRGVYERHQQEPDAVGFGDVVVAQQNLLNSIIAYYTTLSAQWQAVTDLGALFQAETLYDIEQVDLREPAAAPPAPAE